MAALLKAFLSSVPFYPLRNQMSCSQQIKLLRQLCNQVNLNPVAFSSSYKRLTAIIKNNISLELACAVCRSLSSFLLPLQVNNVDFANIIREEAVLFLLDLPKGDDVTILAQKKKDGKG